MEKVQRNQLRIVVLIVFFGFIGISMPYLIFPALFLNPSYSIMPEGSGDMARAVFLGLTLAAYPLGQFVGSPILGSLSDDYGRKGTMTMSLWATALCYLVSGIAIEWANLSLLIFSRLAAGIMEGNIAIARAMAADFTSLVKEKSFAKVNASVSIGYLIGPFFGGALSDNRIWHWFTVATPFYFVCFLFLILAAVAFVVLEHKEQIVKIKPTFWERMNVIKRMSALFINQKLQFFMITSTAFTLAVDIFYEFGPVYLTVKWGLGPSDLIFYNGILCIALALGNGWLATLLSSNDSKRIAILCSIGGFAIFLIGMVITNSTTAMFSLLGLSGISIGIFATLITLKISESVSSQIQGEVMGVQIALRVLGDAAICLFGAALLLLSSKVILIAASLLALATLAYFSRKAY